MDKKSIWYNSVNKNIVVQLQQYKENTPLSTTKLEKDLRVHVIRIPMKDKFILVVVAGLRPLLHHTVSSTKVLCQGLVWGALPDTG